MALNRAYAEANQIKVPVPADTESGDPVVVGELNGVALIDEQDDGEATCQFDGAFYFELTGPISAGDPVTVTDVGAEGGTGSDTFGHALTDVASGVTTDVPVRLSN